MTTGTLYLSVENASFGTGVSNFIAVPVPQADVISVIDDGTVIATAYRRDSGRYTATPHYHRRDRTMAQLSWQDCLWEQLIDSIPDSTLRELFQRGWS